MRSPSPYCLNFSDTLHFDVWYLRVLPWLSEDGPQHQIFLRVFCPWTLLMMTKIDSLIRLISPPSIADLLGVEHYNQGKMSTNLVKMSLKKITFFFSHGSVLLKFLISRVRSFQFLIQITKFGLQIFNIGEHIFFSFILFAKFWMIVCDFFYLDWPLLIFNKSLTPRLGTPCHPMAFQEIR